MLRLVCIRVALYPVGAIPGNPVPATQISRESRDSREIFNVIIFSVKQRHIHYYLSLKVCSHNIHYTHSM